MTLRIKKNNPLILRKQMLLKKMLKKVAMNGALLEMKMTTKKQLRMKNMTTLLNFALQSLRLPNQKCRQLPKVCLSLLKPSLKMTLLTLKRYLRLRPNQLRNQTTSLTGALNYSHNPRKTVNLWKKMALTGVILEMTKLTRSKEKQTILAKLISKKNPLRLIKTKITSTNLKAKKLRPKVVPRHSNLNRLQ